MTWSRFKSFARETTLHGLLDFVNAGLVGKVCWALMLLAAAVLFSLQTSELVTSYLSEETGTEIRSWAPNRIPSISLCPSNYLNNDKVFKNLHLGNISLPWGKDWWGALVNNFMDSFVPMGAVFRMHQGLLDVTAEKLSAGPTIIAAAKFILNEKRVYEKYDHSLEKFVEDNGIGEGELFDGKILVSPMATKYSISRDFTILGLCYVIDFDVEISAVQLAFLQIDLATKELIGGEDYFETSVSRSVNQRIDFRIGSRSYKGVTGFGNGMVFGGNEYWVDVQPSRVERISTKRKPCRPWSYDEYLYCLLEYGSRHCEHCKTMFPREKLSENMTECNYLLANYEGNQHCILQTLNMMSVGNEAKDCPIACAEDQYHVFVHPPQPYKGNGTKIHFLFRNINLSVRQREYALWSPVTLAGTLGGTMGLYFGASLLSLAHVLYYIPKCMVGKEEQIEPDI